MGVGQRVNFWPLLMMTSGSSSEHVCKTLIPLNTEFSSSLMPIDEVQSGHTALQCALIVEAQVCKVLVGLFSPAQDDAVVCRGTKGRSHGGASPCERLE